MARSGHGRVVANATAPDLCLARFLDYGYAAQVLYCGNVVVRAPLCSFETGHLKTGLNHHIGTSFAIITSSI